MNNSAPILQFDECPSSNCAHPQYIYQDLYVGYINKLRKEEPDIFAVCGFQNTDESNMIAREQKQKEFYGDVTGILTMGKWLQRALVENYGIDATKVHHVGGGYNVNAHLIDTTQKMGNKILFIGRDFERKNGPLVVEGFRVAQKIRNDIELYIAGPNNLDIKGDNIYLLGDVSSHDLVKYFNMCDVFCMPSKFEAYGLVFPEALTFGLPCIGRDAYEMPYFIEDHETGYLLRDESPNTLAEMMLDLLKNERIKKNVQSKREWYLEQYSWNNVAKRISTIIESNANAQKGND